jgi:hypothetical protein
LEDGVFVFEHPLRSYQYYVKKYVSNDFELIKQKCGADKIAFRKEIKKILPKNKMRVRS